MKTRNQYIHFFEIMQKCIWKIVISFLFTSTGILDNTIFAILSIYNKSDQLIYDKQLFLWRVQENSKNILRSRL